MSNKMLEYTEYDKEKLIRELVAALAEVKLEYESQGFNPQELTLSALKKAREMGY